MGLLNVPAYAYIDGGTRYINMNIIADDNAYNVIKGYWDTGSYGAFSRFASWTDIDVPADQAHKILNDFFQSYVISNKLDFYVANTLPSGTDISLLVQVLACAGFTPTFYPQTTNSITRMVTLDNVELIETPYQMGTIDYSALTQNSSCQAINFPVSYIRGNTTFDQVHLTLAIFPADVVNGDNVDCTAHIANNDKVMNIEIRFDLDSVSGIITDMYLFFSSPSTSTFETLQNWYDGVNVHVPGSTEDDLENPYGYEGTSTTGGGGGKYGDIDGIEPTDVPDLPTVNAASLGLITLYNPSASQVNNLASYLWSGMFDPDSFKKLFSDPMGCLLGLSIVPAIPATGGTKNIMFGNVDSGISCSYLSTNYVNVDCGSVSIDEYVGSFLDYEPYCKIQLFLPYCGFVPLSADDVVGGSINVQYNVDVLSGHCVAFVKHSVKGVLYSYSGTCITNIPITSQSFSQALQSYYTALAGVGGAAVGALGSGGGGLASVGAEMAKAAMNTMFDMHPQYQHSGSMGGAAAIMGVQTPFVVIVRPRFSVPNQVQNYIGQTSNISRQLGSLSGFTMVEYIHLQGITATSEELKEIEALLKEGVML